MSQDWQRFQQTSHWCGMKFKPHKKWKFELSLSWPENISLNHSLLLDLWNVSKFHHGSSSFLQRLNAFISMSAAAKFRYGPHNVRGTWRSSKLEIERRNAFVRFVRLCCFPLGRREATPPGSFPLGPERSFTGSPTCSEQTSWPSHLLTAHYVICELGPNTHRCSWLTLMKRPWSWWSGKGCGILHKAQRPLLADQPVMFYFFCCTFAE